MNLEDKVRVYPETSAQDTARLLLAAAQHPSEVQWGNPYFIVPARVAVDAGLVEEPTVDDAGDVVEPEVEDEVIEPEGDQQAEDHDLLGVVAAESARDDFEEEADALEAHIEGTKTNPNGTVDASTFKVVHDASVDKIRELVEAGALTVEEAIAAETAEGGKNRKGVLALADEE